MVDVAAGASGKASLERNNDQVGGGVLVDEVTVWERRMRRTSWCSWAPGQPPPCRECALAGWRGRRGKGRGAEERGFCCSVIKLVVSDQNNAVKIGEGVRTSTWQLSTLKGVGNQGEASKKQKLARESQRADLRKADRRRPCLTSLQWWLLVAWHRQIIFKRININDCLWPET